MKILLIITFYLISGAVICSDVIGYSGGSVIIICNHQISGNLPACFCKMKSESECERLIEASTQDVFIHKDRFTLAANQNHLHLMFRYMRSDDAGSYRCGEPTVWNYDINLKINTDPCCTEPTTVRAHVRETVMISCIYPAEFTSNQKVFFKQNTDFVTDLISTSGPDQQKDRYFISDDRQNKVLRVKISDVREEDGGVYHCAVWISGDSVNHYSLYKQIHLVFSADPAETPGPKSDPPHSEHENKQEPTADPAETPDPKSDPPHSAPGSSLIIPVSVCVTLLLLIGGFTLILYKVIHQKIRGGVSSSSRTESEVRYQDHCGSDSGVHLNASSGANSPDAAIYSTVQISADQDQNVTYTAVSFQKNPGDVTVSVSKDDPGTEYATLNL